MLATLATMMITSVVWRPGSSLIAWSCVAVASMPVTCAHVQTRNTAAATNHAIGPA